MDTMTFGEWLSIEMENKGWNQTRLAKKSGLTRQAINNYIANRVIKPDEFALASIAGALELPIETVYKAAGIPTTYLSKEDQHRVELDVIFQNATPEQREDIIRYARFIASENRPRPLTKPSTSEST